VSLSHNKNASIYQKQSNWCRNLLRRVDETYFSFPHFIRWNNDVLKEDLSEQVFLKRLALRQQMLEHKLLLERLAYKRNLLDGQSMVDCAREMLELTVLLWVQRDRLVAHHHDYDVSLEESFTYWTKIDSRRSGCLCAGECPPLEFCVWNFSNK
jgi:hypothetical protein